MLKSVRHRTDQDRRTASPRLATGRPKVLRSDRAALARQQSDGRRRSPGDILRSVAHRRLSAAWVMFTRQVHVSGPHLSGSLDFGGRNGYTPPSQRAHDAYPQTRADAGVRRSEIRAWLGLRCSHTRSESSSSERPRSGLFQMIARRDHTNLSGCWASA